MACLWQNSVAVPINNVLRKWSVVNTVNGVVFTMLHIGDNISTKSSNLKININNVCNLISVSSEQFN